MSDVKAGGAYVEIGARTEQFVKSMRKVRQSLKNVAAQMVKVGGAISAIGAGLAGAMAVPAAEFARFGDRIAKVSQRLGAGTQELSEYHHVANLSGVATRTLDMAWQRMTRRISEAAKGTGEAKNALLELGVSAKRLNMLAPDKQFEAITEAMQGVTNQADRVRLAMRLFDSEGVSLVQIINQGSDAINAMRREARLLGITIDSKAAQAAVRLSDAIQRMKSAFKGVRLAVGGAVAETLSKLAERLAGLLGRVSAWIRDNPAFVDGLLRAALAFTALGAAIAGLPFAALASIVLFIGHHLGVIQGAIDLIKSKWEGFGKGFQDLWDRVKAVGGRIKTVFSAVFDVLVSSAKYFWLRFKGFALDALASVAQAIGTAFENAFQGVMNALKGTPFERFINIDAQVQASEQRKGRYGEGLGEMARKNNFAVIGANLERAFAAMNLQGQFKKIGLDFARFLNGIALPKIPVKPFGGDGDENRSPQIPGVPKGGVAGFFGGMNAREQMGGVGNVEQRQLNEQMQMRRLLQRIVENTDGDGANYA